MIDRRWYPAPILLNDTRTGLSDPGLSINVHIFFGWCAKTARIGMAAINRSGDDRWCITVTN